MTKLASHAQQWLQQCQTAVATYLQALLPPADAIGPTDLCQAMHYAVFNGGKRLRPALVYAVGTDLGASMEQLHPAAAAVELVHCYSLVHDDLPAMDDDDLRRGKPSCHKAFNEATAILAGNALQSLAFDVLATQSQPADNTLKMIQQLAVFSGYQGMGGGQALDLAAEINRPTLLELEKIHELKTGALIRASIILGALAANHQNQHHLTTLAKVATQIGLSFQIQDDILDLTANTATLGKQTGADLKQNKATYPLLSSLRSAQEKATSLIAESEQQLRNLPFPMHHLQQLITLLKDRRK